MQPGQNCRQRWKARNEASAGAHHGLLQTSNWSEFSLR